MHVAFSRLFLFVTGVALVGWAVLAGLATQAGAAPLSIINTPTAEPPTRTATATSVGNVITPTPTGVATATATVPVPVETATSTPVVPTATEEPEREPDRDPDPTATPSPTITSTAVPLIADPAITKSVNRSSVTVGDTVEFTLSVTNLGNATAADVVIEDSLPSFLSLDGVSASRGEVSASGNTVRVTIGDLAPGETVTVTITARVTQAAVAPNNSNVASVSTSSESDTPDNNTSSVSLITEELPSPTATAAPPVSLPNTGESAGNSPIWLAMLGLLLIGVSLFARRKAA